MLPLALGAFIVIAGVAVVLIGIANASAKEADDQLIELLTGDDASDFAATDEFQTRLRERFVDRVLRPGLADFNRAITSRLPGNAREKAQEALLSAGMSQRYRPEEIVTARIGGAIVGLVLGVLIYVSHTFTPFPSLAVLALLVSAGVMLPMVLLSRAAEERQNSIRSDLPDILDLLAISVEAGVAFEGAVAVVCDRFDSPLAEELDRMLKEMELGLPRRDALVSLRERNEVPELNSVIVALIQADTLGMAIGHVLKLQAGEMRLKRRQWAREKAAKLPVKILLPLVFCIFPAVLVVIIGPAGSRIVDGFK